MSTKLLLIGLAVSTLATSGMATTASRLLLRADADADYFGNGSGALTMDSAYRFDFATIGFGSLVFVQRSRSFEAMSLAPSTLPSVVSSYDHDRPLDVREFLGSTNSRGGYNNSAVVLSNDDESVLPVLPIPEASTWGSAALALLTLAVFQLRRSFRRV